MPTYAILGSTGSVGQSILNVLLQSPETHIHAYCRSWAKLSKLQPSINSNKQVEVFEGSLDDTTLLSNCLRGTQTAFLATAETGGNRPGTRVCQDTAHAVVAALKQLKSQNERLPRLVVLSSSSTDHRFLPDTPAPIMWLLYRTSSYVYDDLKAAEKYLRAQDDGLVSATFVKPGALTDDSQKGHRLSMEKADMPLSFLDLAAGMVEIADNQDQYDMKGVAVCPTSKDVSFPRGAPIRLFFGLVFHFFPWLYRFHP
ncbi:putative toxin biosynthesis protein [Pseudovirgaria hyperparasitica]|uniref:Putative toxin biosynthesis protein n=1 Tax=Pseudovirgaria hyperparasitica TaxID=470096 RepID=A0A6A6WF16_9PEZI|nr:putative toxin biosynthesis protein [Pseudovirgaria hyperparasitica]KAF2761412.1 putative toxin biosynthesis protein [Pseudovirgaria hyperparasitica]